MKDLTSRIGKFYEEYRRSIQNMQIVLIGIILLIHEFRVHLGLHATENMDSILLVIILLYVKELCLMVDTIKGNIKCGNQLDLYHEVRSRYEFKTKGSAILFHYSGSMVRDLVQTLFEKGWTIQLYLQAPKSAEWFGSQFQAERIRSMLEELRIDLKHRKGDGKIDVFISPVPLSMRASIFNEECIIAGWYLFGPAETRAKYPDDFAEIRGHDVGGFLIDHRHPDYSYVRGFLSRYQDNIRAEKSWSVP